MEEKINKTGMLLLETVIVLALIALIVVLTYTHTSIIQSVSVRAALDELYSTCQHARMAAYVSGQESSLIFFSQQGKYVWDNYHVQLPNSVIFGCAQGAYGPPANPSRIIAHPVTFGSETITFWPTGIIKSGSVYLTDRMHQCGYALTSSVSSYSYLRRYRYDNKNWNLIDTR